MFKLASPQFKQLHRRERNCEELDGDQRKVSVIKDLKLSVKSHVFLTEMNQRFHRHSATDHPLPRRKYVQPVFISLGAFFLLWLFLLQQGNTRNRQH